MKTYIPYSKANSLAQTEFFYKFFFCIWMIGLMHLMRCAVFLWLVEYDLYYNNISFYGKYVRKIMIYGMKDFEEEFFDEEDETIFSDDNN